MDHKLSFFLSLQFLYFVVSIDFNLREEMEKKCFLCDLMCAGDLLANFCKTGIIQNKSVHKLGYPTH